MKFYLIGILVFFTLAICRSQDEYIPFVKEHKYWFYSTNDGSDVNPSGISAYVLYFQGDTIISSKMYLKVIESTLAGSHPCQFPPCFTPNTPYEFLSSKVIGYVTEDTIQKKVNYLPENISGEICKDSEIEIYDFSLEEGDSLPPCVIHQIRKVSEHVNISEDWGDIESSSTNFAYQKERRTLTFEAPSVFFGMPHIGVINIYEGIGMEYYDPFQYTNNTIFSGFCEGSLSDCNILGTSAIDPNRNLNTIKISPNPTSNYININSQILFKRFEIFDQRGKVLHSSHHREIDVSNLPSGIYNLRLLSNDNQFYFSRFVKLQ